MKMLMENRIFRDIEVEWAQESPSKISKRMPAAGLMVREITANFADTWHPAPRRQYVISLGGAVDITASDGETRHIAAGEIVLVEDTTGEGHTKSSGSTPPVHALRAHRLKSSSPSRTYSGFSARSQLLIFAPARHASILSQ